jgi:transcriptional regulator with XRE-family HTH domain
MHNYRMITNTNLHIDALTIARKAREINLTQAKIAIAISASQSQVSRVLSGNARRRSRLFVEICEYVNSFAIVDRSAAVKKNEELMSALASVWNGTPQHARAIALVIRSLGGMSPTEPAATTNLHKKEQER